MRRRGGLALLAVLAVVACSAVLMLSAKRSDGRPSELFFADHMGEITAGAGLSSRLPEDQGLGQVCACSLQPCPRWCSSRTEVSSPGRRPVGRRCGRRPRFPNSRPTGESAQRVSSQAATSLHGSMRARPPDARTHNAQGLKMRDDGDGLADGFAEAHWDSTRLPDDKQGRAQLVHGGRPGDMTDPLDGNKAAALRSQVTTLEATQGQIDGFVSQLPYKYYIEEVASVGD